MSMKYCNKCKTLKVTTEFGENKGKKDGLQSNCKDCRNNYLKGWYQLNKPLHLKRVRKTDSVRRIKLRQQMMEYYESHPCIDCGETDPVVLEFDHLGDKSYNVCKMLMHGMSWQNIEKELAKCEVRCANCHKRKTAKAQNWYKYRVRETVISPGP